MPDFIQAKQFFAAVLKVPENEGQIVSLILQGLDAETRSRMVFAVEPHTSAELFDLAARVSNYAFIDSLARPSAPPQPSFSPSRHVENRPRRPVNCYNCGRPGHVARDCTRRRNQNSNSAHNSSNANVVSPVQNPL